MFYLFLGQDTQAKNTALERLRREHLAKSLEQFNLDILYARGLSPKELQEKLLCLPVKSPKRIVVIKDAHNLEEEVKEFILGYVLKPHSKIILVLDAESADKKDEFIGEVSRRAKVFRFKEVMAANTFDLSRQIDLRRPDYALRVLNHLLANGERPERILGGLRYSCERDRSFSPATKRKLKLLLDCDIDIKTGRLRPAFAMEKLVIALCGTNSGNSARV